MNATGRNVFAGPSGKSYTGIRLLRSAATLATKRMSTTGALRRTISTGCSSVCCLLIGIVLTGDGVKQCLFTSQAVIAISVAQH